MSLDSNFFTKKQIHRHQLPKTLAQMSNSKRNSAKKNTRVYESIKSLGSRHFSVLGDNLGPNEQEITFSLYKYNNLD